MNFTLIFKCIYGELHFYSRTTAIIEWPFDLAAAGEQLVNWSIFLKSCDVKKTEEWLDEAGAMCSMNFYSTLEIFIDSKSTCQQNVLSISYV